ncbi:hypothetical protein B0J12DRAFT_782025 [Macrophomina phaseolina]|uniref:Uncharacterized protein n=1 Tax=Macrophomina phaseolina TaxID=35725 RepID=A0ABQ8GMT2_9PEZI|nr:hypothetical protein B0J12DRAFT_782025 [Macrophomina phaseolina]
MSDSSLHRHIFPCGAVSRKEAPADPLRLQNPDVDAVRRSHVFHVLPSITIEARGAIWEDGNCTENADAIFGRNGVGVGIQPVDNVVDGAEDAEPGGHSEDGGGAAEVRKGEGDGGEAEGRIADPSPPTAKNPYLLTGSFALYNPFKHTIFFSLLFPAFSAPPARSTLTNIFVRALVTVPLVPLLYLRIDGAKLYFFLRHETIECLLVLRSVVPDKLAGAGVGALCFAR